MNTFEYNQESNNYIKGHMNEFYQEMYKDTVVQSLSNNSLRLQPCPICGHHDCCTVTDRGVKCFSCDDFKGSHVKAYFMYAEQKLGLKEPQARDELSKFTKIEIPNMSPQEKIEYEKFKRTQEILSLAEDYYHKKLMTCKQAYMFADKKVYTPLEYMLKIRRRAQKTLEDFKVGFVYDRAGLETILKKKGFSKEEIKESKVWSYEDVFIFYYKDPESGYITRHNIKNPFEVKKKIYNEDGTYSVGDIIKGASSSNKTFFYTPHFTFSKPFIAVEGEHDLMALYEQGEENVCCAGGNFIGNQNRQMEVLDKAEDIIYTCFDNDSAGVNYTNFLNDYLCDKDIRKIEFDLKSNDIDEYYRDSMRPVPFKTLKEHALVLETEKSRIRERRGMEWSIATRTQRIDFVIKKQTDTAGLTGDISCYEDKIVVELFQNKALGKLPKKFRSLGIDLQQEIDRYYNRGIYTLGFDELVKMHRFSLRKKDIERRLAEMMSQDKELEDYTTKIHRILGSGPQTSDFVDELLKVRSNLKAEANGINASSIVQIKLAETFDVMTGLGYVYFNYHKVDADGTMKRLPYLLRSDGELIRLDLFKKSDPNSVLLIDGKFELLYEVPCAITSNECISLKDYWVEKFIAKEIPEGELDPGYLAKRLEKYVESFYFFTDRRYYKIVTMYIMLTYFYECFSSIPYLYLNGEKGSGKTTLGAIINAFAFNSKLSIDISASALFRTVAIEGGTFIIDELEKMTSRAKSQESDFGPVLKGGYYKEGRVFRTNTEQGNRTESFNVYGPKVLMNIFGLDDVIEDRCITIKIPKVKCPKNIKDLLEWKQKYQSEQEEVTSKLALCAITHFKRVMDITHNVFVSSSSSRLSQILKPMMTIARLCDENEIRQQLLASPQLSESDVTGTYEKTFTDFCDDVLAFLKDSVEKNTPEGIIKTVIYEISRELLDLVSAEEKEFTKPDLHKYSTPVKYYEDEYKFEINALHVKTFIEEATPENTSYSMKNNKMMMNIFNLSKEDMENTYIPVTDKELIKDINNTKRPRMWKYTIHIAQIYPELIAEKKKREEKEGTEIDDLVANSEGAF